MTDALRLRELESVLRLLLNLHDPPSEAARRRYTEDERGWNLILSGAVRRGRILLPKPPPCKGCGGNGGREKPCSLCGDSTYDHLCNDEWIACPDCAGEGYRREPEPVTETERQLWAEIGARIEARGRCDG